MLRPDGWIQLLDPIGLPSESCEVEVTLSVSKPAVTTAEPPNVPAYEPSSGFYPDESISAPFDLPHYGPARLVTARKATGPYLPDPVFIAIGEEVLE